MHYTRSKTALFLIELILAIFFFSVASAVCVQLFAQAQQRSWHTEALDAAMLRLENSAETYTATGGSFAAAAQVLGEADAAGQEAVVVYYDRQFTPCDQAQAAYALTARQEQEGGGLTTLYLCAQEVSSGQTLCQLEQAVYTPPA